jgi:hypothetical protein
MMNNPSLSMRPVYWIRAKFHIGRLPTGASLGWLEQVGRTLAIHWTHSANGVVNARMVKILERMEPGIFQTVTSNQIGLLKRKTPLAVYL